MIKNNYDSNSIISSRKSSRLSNFNPMKNRNKVDLNLSNQPSMNNINANNSPYYNPLTPTMTNYSDNSSTSGGNSNSTNYNLTKMETNDSIDSNYSLQQQFKIELNLSKKEIELIRFTWNKMLLDEPIVKTNTNLPIPGTFNFSSNTSHSNNNHHTNGMNGGPNMPPPKSASTIASSLFCRQLYGNLLSMDSNLEKLFPSIKHQAVAFAGVMSFTISQLENLSNLDDYLENLGKRHSRILGIEPSMFELMGEALIQTFHERFGNKFSQELEILWIKLYLFLSNSLLQFGIDPILKLNKNDNLSSNNSVNSNIFKLNEINDYQFNPSIHLSNNSLSTLNNSSNSNSTTTSNTNSHLNNHHNGSILSGTTVNSSYSRNDLYEIDEKKISTGLKDKKDKDIIKKKKRDCVVQ